MRGFGPLLMAKKGGRRVDIGYVGSFTHGFMNNPYTFTAEALGGAASDRITLLGIAANAYSATANSIASIAVGGLSATKIRELAFFTSGRLLASLWAVDTSSLGATADILVTPGASEDVFSCAVWRMTGASGVAAHATDASSTDPATASLAVPTRGGAVGVAFGSPAAWTGLGEDADLGTTYYLTAAHANFVAAQSPLSISVDLDNTYHGAVFASWDHA